MHWLEEFEDVVNKVKNPDFRSKKRKFWLEYKVTGMFANCLSWSPFYSIALCLQG